MIKTTRGVACTSHSSRTGRQGVGVNQLNATLLRKPLGTSANQHHMLRVQHLEEEERKKERSIRRRRRKKEEKDDDDDDGGGDDVKGR